MSENEQKVAIVTGARTASSPGTATGARRS